MQRTISGFHLLTMMSIVDNVDQAGDDIRLRSWLIKNIPSSITEQDKIIRDWLTHQFVMVNLDPEMEKLTQLNPEEFDHHLQWHIDNFYTFSTAADRIDLLKFAMELIKLDGIITHPENKFFNMLYEAWTEPGQNEETS